MQKKITLAFYIFFVFLIICMSVFFYYQKINPPQIVNPEPGVHDYFFPAPPTTEDKEKMIVRGVAGQEVEVANIYLAPVEKLSNNGLVFRKSTSYYMAFFPQDQSFLISILNAQVEVTRKSAQEEFLKALGISEKEACQLKILVSVPDFINSNLSGKNLGLSFCSHR